MRRFPLFLLAALCAVLSALPIPLVSEVARICLAGYFVGSAICSLIMPSSTHVERALVSIAASASVLLLVSLVFPPNSFAARLAFAVVALVLLLFSLPRRHRTTRTGPSWLLVLGICTVPFLLIFISNPFIHYLSDGWWHFGIAGLLKHSALPMQTPWLAGASFAYPFAMHVFFTYLFGTLDVAPHLPFAIGTVVAAGLMGLLVYTLARDAADERTGVWAAAAFLLFSTVGAVLFVLDAFRLVFMQGVPAFLSFLKAHQGPHMWYTAMKFIDLTGVNTVFQSTAMLAFFPGLLYTGTIYFLLRRQHLLAAVVFLPLFAANPVFAIVGGACIGVTLLYDRGVRGILPGFAVAAGALLVSAIYLRSLFTKELVASGGFVSLLPQKGLLMLLLFGIGYLPFIIAAIYEYRRGAYDRRWRTLLLLFAAANLAVTLTLSLGYLYASTTAVIILMLLAAPYLARFRWRWSWAQLLRGMVVALSLTSTLLIVATYTYYTIDLDEREIAASRWLRDHSEPGETALVYLGPLEERVLKIYPSVFAERPVYIADIYTLTAYGENFSRQQRTYNAVFSEKDGAVLCSLPEQGVRFVYVPPGGTETSWIASVPCASAVYEEQDVVIYSLA